MKNLFWFGVVLAVLGIASFFIPFPHTEHEGVKAGGLSLGIETRHSETLPPVASSLIVAAGAGMIIAAKSRGN